MTRKRRYLISAAVLAACVCAAWGVVSLLPPRPGVTKANFGRIEKGMSQTEVDEILGKGAVRLFAGYGSSTHAWLANDRACVHIVFGFDGVIGKYWVPSPENFTDKLRRWLHVPK